MANTIIVGSGNSELFRFTDANIRSISASLASSLSGDELAWDVADISVFSEAYLHVKFVPKGSSRLITKDGDLFTVFFSGNHVDEIPYGCPIYWYKDGKLFGKFYSNKAQRIGKTDFSIEAVSAIGILDGVEHRGGVYTGQSFSSVLSEMIGNAFPYSVSDDVKDLPVYGWLPIDTSRNNMHQLVFAYGVQIAKDTSGNMLFQFPDDQNFTVIPKSRTYVSGSVQYVSPATEVNVVEHAYLTTENDETVRLFDSAEQASDANRLFIRFAEPIHDLAASENLTINESGANYAIVTGSGTLDGKKYTHTETVIVRTQKSARSVSPKSVKINKATLVNAVNSSGAADRMMSYYSSARTVKSDIILADEKPGQLVQFVNAFEEDDNGFIGSMNITASAVTKAGCEIITGYKPTHGEAIFTHVVVINKNSTFTVPSGIKKIRVVMIGGGNGGTAGTSGGNAIAPEVESAKEFVSSSTTVYELYTLQTNQEGSEGGLPGLPGSGGKVYRIDLDVSGGQQFSAVIGEGGKGEVFGGSAATNGTETTFGSYSSASGSVFENGYIDILAGKLYAKKGLDGFSGGKGAARGFTPEPLFINGVYYNAGGRGEQIGNPNSFDITDRSSGVYIGGDTNQHGRIYIVSEGGFGGGAAYGLNGNKGNAAQYNMENEARPVLFAAGGNGADAQKPELPLLPGQGGAAGNGGGGAGGFAFGDIWCRHSKTGDYGTRASLSIEFSNAIPGKGSDGGDGANGCVIVYY